jgi:hypothetical protein
MEVPLPFTRVCIAVGKMISMPADVSIDDLPHWAALLGAEIDLATRLAEQRVGTHVPLVPMRLDQAEPVVNRQLSQTAENTTP